MEDMTIYRDDGYGNPNFGAPVFAVVKNVFYKCGLWAKPDYRMPKMVVEGNRIYVSDRQGKPDYKQPMYGLFGDFVCDCNGGVVFSKSGDKIRRNTSGMKTPAYVIVRG
ncbi:MAG: hypothetical protein E7Z63_03890 [Thermoplasmata archaeon]|nr:hypothetical protein [Thermoplasmata archaeon]